MHTLDTRTGDHVADVDRRDTMKAIVQ